MKNDYIITLADFKLPEVVSENADAPEVNEGISDIFSKGFSMLGDGLENTIKQKAIAYVLEFLKIKEKSPVSKLVQEIFEEIEFKDYYGIVSGQHTNWDYFIPKIADGFIEFLERSGFDEVAESLGIESDGWLYNILRESISDRISKRANFKKDIENFLKKIFKGNSPAKAFNAKDIVNSMSTSDKKGVINDIKKGTSNAIKDSDGIIDFLSDLISGGGEKLAGALK